MSKAIAEPPVAVAIPREAGAIPVEAGSEVDSPQAIRRLVIKLAWPSIVENMLQSIFNIIMIGMVARLGSAAIAGVGASTSIIQVAMSCFFALSMGTTVLVAHATGAKNREAASRAAKQSLVLGLIIGGIISLLGIVFAPQAIAAVGAEQAVVGEGASYLRAFSLGGIFIVTTFVAGGVMRGSGDARTPMLVTLASLAASLGIGYPLIFGQFGLPKLGAFGAGLATTGARGLGCLVLIVLLLRPTSKISLAGWGGWRPALEPVKRLLRIGLPSMFESLFRAGGMLFFSVIVFKLGTEVAASQQVAQQVAFFSMMPGFGFSMAAMTLVGQALGANNPGRASRASWFSTRSCLAWMGSMGLVFFFFGHWIMGLFTSDQVIIENGAVALKMIALAQPGQAFGMVLAGSLRGSGDTSYPMFATGAAMWFVRLPLAYLFGIVLGFGLGGVYLGWVVDTVVLASLNWLRYRTGRWQERKVAIA
ncbi:MAG: MATE family efflux transporter [Thermomicrobiales bacterium]